MFFQNACRLSFMMTFCCTIPASSAIEAGDVPLTQAVGEAIKASARSILDVQNVICQERVERYRSSRKGSKDLLDTVETRVSVENGSEQYSAIRQNGMERQSVDELGDVWSGNEYATFIREAERALNNELITRGVRTSLTGTPAIVIIFEMAEAVSDWDFCLRGEHRRLRYQGEIWVSQQTGELLKCRRLASELDRASGVKAIEWVVDFGIVDVAGKRVSLPVSGSYEIRYNRLNKVSHNAIVFTDYHRFGAESTVNFR
jgi:hypothetical protein